MKEKQKGTETTSEGRFLQSESVCEQEKDRNKEDLSSGNSWVQVTPQGKVICGPTHKRVFYQRDSANSMRNHPANKIH